METLNLAETSSNISHIMPWSHIALSVCTKIFRSVFYSTTGPWIIDHWFPENLRIIIFCRSWQEGVSIHQTDIKTWSLMFGAILRLTWQDIKGEPSLKLDVPEMEISIFQVFIFYDNPPKLALFKWITDESKSSSGVEVSL